MYYDNGRKGQYQPEGERWGTAPDIRSAVEVIAGVAVLIVLLLGLRWLMF